MIDPKANFRPVSFSQFNILPTVHSCIIIPVKDEEEYIQQTLLSFVNQIDQYGEAIDSNQFEILVLANNCSDNSTDIIKTFQRIYPSLNIYLQEVTLSGKQANIGYVRKALMECAYNRLSNNGGGIIMTTDGDTSVAPDWICQTIAEINSGADAVGGRILFYQDEVECLDQSTLSHFLKDEEYQLLIAELEGKIIGFDFDPVPRHHQHFNGSFAITTDCYARSGGIPQVEYLEDCAFFEKLQTIDAKVRHSNKVKVYTSARFAGRTQTSLSHQLGVWKDLGQQLEDYYVESCASVTNRFEQKKHLLNLWKLKNTVNRRDFFRMLKIAIPEINFENAVYPAFVVARYFGEWHAKMENDMRVSRQALFPPVPIETAIKDLKSKIKEVSDHDFCQTSIL